MGYDLPKTDLLGAGCFVVLLFVSVCVQ